MNSERWIYSKLKRDNLFISFDYDLNEDLSFRNSFLQGVFTVPGDGCIDYKPLMKILFENQYQDWLVIEAEQDPVKANPSEYAKIG